jgi:hypothetical protein
MAFKGGIASQHPTHRGLRRLDNPDAWVYCSSVGTVRARGFEFKVFPKDHDPVHAHVEFDNGVLLIAFVDGLVVPLETRGSVRPPDIKKALIVAVSVYDEVLAEWERMQQ